MALKLVAVGLEQEAEVLAVLTDCPRYYLACEGEPPWPEVARFEMTALPPSVSADRKLCLLATNEMGPVAFVDLLRDFPVAGKATLGLLAVREGLQGRGLGRLVYESVEERVVADWGTRCLRLGVCDTNPVQPFWERMGFRDTGERKPYRGRRRDSTIIVMEKSLA